MAQLLASIMACLYAPVAYLVAIYQSLGLNFKEFVIAMAIVSAVYKYLLTPLLSGNTSKSDNKD